MSNSFMSPEMKKDEEPKPPTLIPPCFLDSTRPSGTDLRGAVIKESKAATVLDCQAQCQGAEACRHFLYFSERHYQRYKHRTCRLLRERGREVPDQVGHVSGPKVG